jgi:hypothetical protein
MFHHLQSRFPNRCVKLIFIHQSWLSTTGHRDVPRDPDTKRSQTLYARVMLWTALCPMTTMIPNNLITLAKSAHQSLLSVHSCALPSSIPAPLTVETITRQATFKHRPHSCRPH